MKILLIDNGSTFINELTTLCQGFGEVEIQSFGNVTGSNADMLVLSGGHNHSIAGHPADFHNELALVRGFEGPIIGVCLGHEILAYLDGVELTELPIREKGPRRIDVILDDPIFEGVHSFSAYESHRWAVNNTNDLVPLARSVDGIEVMRHKTKPIYGIQFHPEHIENGLSGKRLFQKAVTELNAGHLNSF